MPVKKVQKWRAIVSLWLSCAFRYQLQSVPLIAALLRILINQFLMLSLPWNIATLQKLKNIYNSRLHCIRETAPVRCLTHLRDPTPCSSQILETYLQHLSIHFRNFFTPFCTTLLLDNHTRNYSPHTPQSLSSATFWLTEWTSITLSDYQSHHRQLRLHPCRQSKQLCFFAWFERLKTCMRLHKQKNLTWRPAAFE